MKEKMTEQALLKAAEDEFLEKGFAGAKTMNIAERAGVSHTMLHYYFRTKEQLFARVAEEKMMIFVDSLKPLFEESEGSMKERVARAVGAHFDAVMANPMVPRFMLMEMLNDKVDFYTILKQIIGVMIATKAPVIQKELDEAAARGETVRMSVMDLIFDIISLNYFPFLLFPMATRVLEMDSATQAAFLLQRRQEAIDTILRRLAVIG